MKARISLGILLLALGGGLAPCQEQQTDEWSGWRVRKDADAMTDRQITQLETLSVPTGSQLGKGPPAKLAVQCSQGKIEVGLYASEPLMVMDVFGKEGGQDNPFAAFSRDYGKKETYVRLRFDNEKASGKDAWIMEDFTFLKARGEGKTLTKKMLRRSKLLVEYEAASGETRVAAFEVSGLKEKIAPLTECGRIE
jgi:hypothetical protein